MNKLPKVAVLGGGRAATAIAGDLSLMGCQVNLYELDQFKHTIEPIKHRGGIEITGETQSGKNGLANLNTITTDPKEAIQGVDLIMVAVPAFAHKAFFDAFSPHLEEGQSILVNTSYWSSLRFANKLKKIGIFDKITLAEAMIMPYLSNKIGPAATHIHRTKQNFIALSAFPATKTDKILELVQTVYPQHKKVPNVLWTSLGNMNTPTHAPLTIPVAGLIYDRYSDGSQGGAKLYGEATTPGARLIEAYDLERLSIARKLGVNLASAAETTSIIYGYKGKDLAEALRKSEHAEMFFNINFQKELLEEDLRYFYVSLSQLGDSLGISTPVTKSILTILSTMLDINYWEGATTLEDIGLAGLNKDQIITYVLTGKV
jgi:opine dehydrogenase